MVAIRVDPDIMVGLLPQAEQAGEAEKAEQAPFAAVVVAVVTVAAVAHSGRVGGVGRGCVGAVAVAVLAGLALGIGIGRLVGELAGLGLDVIGLLGNLLRLLGQILLGRGRSRKCEDGGGRERGPQCRSAHEFPPVAPGITHRAGSQTGEAETLFRESNERGSEGLDIGGGKVTVSGEPRESRVAETKTKPSDSSVDSFLEAVEHPVRRADGKAVRAMMERATGERAVMWGPSIVGFGSCHYRYASGHEGDMCRVGFSPRSANLVLYVGGFPEYEALLARLGKHKSSKACLYLNRLADVDLEVLEEIARRTYAASRDCDPVTAR